MAVRSSPDTQLLLIAFRGTRRVADEVRKIAKRDGETCASTYRRLLRTALELERRNSGNNEAA